MLDVVAGSITLDPDAEVYAPHGRLVQLVDMGIALASNPPGDLAAAPAAEPPPPSVTSTPMTPVPPAPPAAPSWETTASGRVTSGPYDTDPSRAWIRVAGELTPEVSDDFDRIAEEIKIKYPGQDAVDVLLTSDGGRMTAGIFDRRARATTWLLHDS